MTERLGIEIDYCPQCRGIWLDRGELDKIIERSRDEGTDMRSGTVRRNHDDDEHDEHGRRDDVYRHDGYKGHKKKSFLKDLLDFG
jgi:Zn-finger nucleic acid-binding protein